LFSKNACNEHTETPGPDRGSMKRHGATNGKRRHIANGSSQYAKSKLGRSVQTLTARAARGKWSIQRSMKQLNLGLEKFSVQLNPKH
jgi:hypothetical protein